MKRASSIVLVVMCVGWTTACSSDTPGAGCNTNAECAAGEACFDATCAALCRADGDCASGEICVSDVCKQGERGNAPVITTVDANGPPDTATGHVPHRINDRLIIVGRNLNGAAVELSDGITTWPLEVCDAAANRLEVSLPDGLTSERHTS